LDTRITVFLLGVGINVPQDPPHDNVCNNLYRDGVLAGFPTVPGAAYVWNISMVVTNLTPTANNARVRCKFKIKYFVLDILKKLSILYFSRGIGKWSITSLC